MENNPLFDGGFETNYRIHCPKGCDTFIPNVKVTGSSVFKEDSSICVAGIHSGLIS